jgi:hypothetical protein
MSENSRLNQTREAMQDKPARTPKEADFSGKAVTGTVLKESIEHPATIYPLACSALALGWTVMIAASPVSIGLSFGLAFVGASSFVYNYVVKGPERVALHIAEMREARRGQSIDHLGDLVATCERAGLHEGAKEASELGTAFIQLMRFFDERKQDVTTEKFRQLADDSFKQGIATIEHALATHKAMAAINVRALQDEVSSWQKELKRLDPESSRAKALSKQVESHQRRLELHSRGMDKLTQLLADSNEIESALQSTYVELVDLGNEDMQDFLREDSSASSRLRNAVDVARRVEQRLRGGEDAEFEAKKNKYLDLQEQTTENIEMDAASRLEQDTKMAAADDAQSIQQ